MKVAIIGSQGQLGSELVRVFLAGGWETVALTHNDFDVISSESILPPVDVVINCAAYHNFDDCEKYPLLAYAGNALGALNVAREASRIGAFNVYISTDYVFGNIGGYLPSDRPIPKSVYAVSKFSGEELTRIYSQGWAVVRFGSLFGGVPRMKGLSFVDQILAKLKEGKPFTVVSDQFVSPTYTKDVARGIKRICEQRSPGIFHLSNQGRTSYYEFAQEIARQAGLPESLIEPRVENDPRRPKDCSTISQNTRSWQEALAEYLREKGYAAS